MAPVIDYFRDIVCFPSDNKRTYLPKQKHSTHLQILNSFAVLFEDWTLVILRCLDTKVAHFSHQKPPQHLICLHEENPHWKCYHGIRATQSQVAVSTRMDSRVSPRRLACDDVTLDDIFVFGGGLLWALYRYY